MVPFKSLYSHQCMHIKMAGPADWSPLIWSHGQKGVIIHESWRVMINHLITHRGFRALLPVNLFQRALRIAKDHTIRELLLTSKKLPVNEQKLNCESDVRDETAIP